MVVNTEEQNTGGNEVSAQQAIAISALSLSRDAKQQPLLVIAPGYQDTEKGIAND